jgi:HPt (histidine-containing phosphotransfer) domain-containing protein
MADLHSPNGTTEEVTGKLHELLTNLWSRSQQTIAERLEVLRVSHRTLGVTPSDPVARRAGADAAHKLAGILGTFGLPTGTEVARRIEVLLDSSAALRKFDLDTLQHSIGQLQQMIEEKSKTAGKRRA